MSLRIDFGKTLEVTPNHSGFDLELFASAILSNFDNYLEFKKILSDNSLLLYYGGGITYIFNVVKLDNGEFSLVLNPDVNPEPEAILNFVENSTAIERDITSELIIRKMSHDIANPLTAIIMNVDYVKSRLESISHSDINAIIEGLDGAKSSSTKIRKMIDTFRSMSFEASTLIKSKSLSSKTVDPILISMLQRILDKSTQRAIVHVSINGGKFNDMSMIDQWLILKNLITNSFEASVDDKPAFIDIVTFDSQFTLKDKGKGFVQEFLNLTKEAFYSDKEGHLGMGLSIVDYLAKRQRARLKVSQADMTTIQILF